MPPEASASGPWLHRLRQIVPLVLALGVAAWLGYALGRGQSLAEVAGLYRDQVSMDYTLDDGQLVVEFARAGGDLKPLVRLPDGTPLVDYSDWDYNAVVLVDGQRYEQVRLVPNATADYARNRIVAGLDAGDWLLDREITLDGPTASVRYLFVTKRPVAEVRVTVAHANWYYLDVRVANDGYSGTIAKATRAEIESGLVRSASYQVTVSATSSGESVPDFVRVASSTPFGVQSVDTQYLLRNPEVGVYTPLATERITWQQL
jgi:hypothetical protein